MQSGSPSIGRITSYNVCYTKLLRNHSMASNYNRLPRPAMVLTDSGEHRLSVRRETFEDLIAREL